jgi:hypothetical protein
MTQTQVLNWIVSIAVVVGTLSIGFTFFYLRYVREKIRQHRDVKRMVTEASKPMRLQFEPTSHAKQR